MIFALANFSAIIIDWTDKNTADDANVLGKSHEKLRRGLSKLFLNYSMKTNGGKRCLTDS